FAEKSGVENTCNGRPRPGRIASTTTAIHTIGGGGCGTGGALSGAGISTGAATAAGSSGTGFLTAGSSLPAAGPFSTPSSIRPCLGNRKLHLVSSPGGGRFFLFDLRRGRRLGSGCRGGRTLRGRLGGDLV